MAAENGALRYGATLVPVAPGVDTRLLGIRPEHIEITAPGGGTLDATVEVKEALGGESYVYLRTAKGDRLVAKADGEHPASPGDAVGLSFPTRRLHLFSADGTALAVARPGGTA